MSMSCDDGDGEPVANYRSGSVVARTEHWCACCAATIRPGDVHYSASWVCCGVYESFRRCARCQLLFLALVKLHKQRRILDEETGDLMGVDPALNCGHSFQKVFGEEPPPELARLAFMTAGEVQALLAAGMAS